MGAGGARIRTIQPGNSASPEEESQTHGGQIWPEATIPRATSANRFPLSLKTPTEEIMALIKTLPQSSLASAQISFDWVSVEREAMHPIGGRLSRFVHNWIRVTSNPWVLKTIEGYELQFMTIPPIHLYHPPSFQPGNDEGPVTGSVGTGSQGGHIQGAGRWHRLCQPLV